MDRYWQQILALWARWQALSFARKLTWTLAAISCLGIAGVAWWAAQPEYRALYTGLSFDEAAAITSKLQAKGVPFRLAAGGTTIMVPAEQAMQAFVENDGVPGSSKLAKGLDAFDHTRIGATPFENSVTLM